MKIAAPQKMNISQMSALALATKDLAFQMSTPNKQQVFIDGNDNPADTNLANADNVSEFQIEPTSLPTKSGDTYFPIQVIVPDNSVSANGKQPLTEEEKRQRAIIIGSCVLLAMIVLISILSFKKAS